MRSQEFEKELEERIAQVEKGAAGVRPMKKREYVEVAVIAFVCLAGIVAGAFL